MNKYYCIIDGRRKGPLTIREMLSFEIKDDTMVQCVGDNIWKRAGNVRELSLLFDENLASTFLTTENVEEIKDTCPDDIKYESDKERNDTINEHENEMKEQNSFSNNGSVNSCSSGSSDLQSHADADNTQKSKTPNETKKHADEGLPIQRIFIVIGIIIAMLVLVLCLNNCEEDRTGALSSRSNITHQKTAATNKPEDDSYKEVKVRIPEKRKTYKDIAEEYINKLSKDCKVIKICESDDIHKLYYLNIAECQIRCYDLRYNNDILYETDDYSKNGYYLQYITDFKVYGDNAYIIGGQGHTGIGFASETIVLILKLKTGDLKHLKTCAEASFSGNKICITDYYIKEYGEYTYENEYDKNISYIDLK